MRILFVTSNRVGDAVLSTGLLDHLIRVHPAARITVACGPYAEGVFARMPNRERTLLLDKRPWNLHWLPLWAWAAGRRWDLVVDLRGSALSYLVRTGRRAVMRSRRPGCRIGHKTAQLAAVLGLDDPPLPVAWTGPDDRARAAALLPAGPPVVALGPTANWQPKAWPAETASAAAELASLGTPEADRVRADILERAGDLPGAAGRARPRSPIAPCRRRARWTSPARHTLLRLAAARHTRARSRRRSRRCARADRRAGSTPGQGVDTIRRCWVAPVRMADIPRARAARRALAGEVAADLGTRRLAEPFAFPQRPSRECAKSGPGAKTHLRAGALFTMFRGLSPTGRFARKAVCW